MNLSLEGVAASNPQDLGMATAYTYRHRQATLDAATLIHIVWLDHAKKL
jgi:hypothetical protein